MGAGYGGSFLATSLAGSDLTTTLVDKRVHHELTQEIHLVAAGFRNPEETRIPISSLVSDTSVQFLQDTVRAVHLREKTVLMESGSVSYDVLVIALGALTEYFDVPGAEKHAQPLRSMYDAKKIYEHVKSLIDSGSNGEVVVIGGGATGVSIAGALSDFIRLERNADRVSIKVVEASESLLYGWDRKVAQKAREILEKKGVQVILGARVTECLPGIIKLQDGRGINFSIAVWTAGIKAYGLDTAPAVPKTRNGRILVDEFCQLKGWSDVYAIGDISAASDGNEGFYPATAQVAVRQAKYLADRLHARTQEGFDYEVNAQVLSLGIDEHILMLGNMVVTGSLAKLVEEFSKNAYRKTIESGGSDMSAGVYGRDILSKALAGVTFAGFAFRKAFG